MTRYEIITRLAEHRQKMEQLRREAPTLPSVLLSPGRLVKLTEESSLPLSIEVGRLNTYSGTMSLSDEEITKLRDFLNEYWPKEGQP